jgi:bifunctional non-homologous end joining protein LigD
MPEGPEWQLELKLDGDRGIGIKSNSRAHLASRDGRNFSEQFPTITRALNRLPDETVVDGEIAAVNENGVPSFNLLQNGGAGHTILFYAFDLLVLAGTDLRSRPLEQRRALLRELITKLGDPIRHSETFDVPAVELLATVRQHGLEGIVAKRRSSTYRPGDRSGDWVKMRREPRPGVRHRARKGTLGRRAHRGGHETIPVAQASTCRVDRVSRMDARE